MSIDVLLEMQTYRCTVGVIATMPFAIGKVLDEAIGKVSEMVLDWCWTAAASEASSSMIAHWTKAWRTVQIAV